MYLQLPEYQRNPAAEKGEKFPLEVKEVFYQQEIKIDVKNICQPKIPSYKFVYLDLPIGTGVRTYILTYQL